MPESKCHSPSTTCVPLISPDTVQADSEQNFEGDRLATGEGSVDLCESLAGVLLRIRLADTEVDAVDYYPQNDDCANNNYWRPVQTLTRPVRDRFFACLEYAKIRLCASS